MCNWYFSLEFPFNQNFCHRATHAGNKRTKEINHVPSVGDDVSEKENNQSLHTVGLL